MSKIYRSIDPWCPICETTFGNEATVIDTFQTDGSVHHIINCGGCETPWEVCINYDRVTVCGVEVWTQPAIAELRPNPS